MFKCGPSTVAQGVHHLQHDHFRDTPASPALQQVHKREPSFLTTSLDGLLQLLLLCKSPDIDLDVGQREPLEVHHSSDNLGSIHKGLRKLPKGASGIAAQIGDPTNTLSYSASPGGGHMN